MGLLPGGIYKVRVVYGRINLYRGWGMRITSDIKVNQKVHDAAVMFLDFLDTY